MSFIISYYNLYSKQILPSATRTIYNQQAHILIANSIIISYVLFKPTYNSNTFKSIIIIAINVLIALSTKTIITLINSKEIIIIKVIILRISIISSLLFSINKPSRLIASAKEKEQN